jgi:SAM-dependent methyltransferase
VDHDVHEEIHEDLDRASPARLELTRRAFRLLPKLDRPRILDVGCGRGGPTLELANSGAGEVIGLDIDRDALDDLAAEIEARGLGERVRIVQGSMSEMDFAAESFDIIWAEGSIWVVGFEAGLEILRKFLKPGGHLVIHEMAWLRPDPPEQIAKGWRGVYPGIRTSPEYEAAIRSHGYEIVGTFTLPEEFWWSEYYEPLQERIRDLRHRYEGDQRALELLAREQQEVDLYRRYMSWYGSAYFAMRKPARSPAP